MESKESIMEDKVNSLQRCLDSIYKVIRTANDTLCAISKPSVCSEVLLSPQGIAYISGITEVYRVAKRVEGGMKSLSISTETLQKSLRDIEIIWNNVQAFMSFNPSVLRMMPAESTLDCSALTALENAQNEICGVCLLRTLNKPNDFSDTEHSVLHNGCHYHASCANFWLNCVDSNLPGLIAPKQNSEDLNLEELSVLGQNCLDTNPKDFTLPIIQ
ncbi:synergin gamma-like isoform X2 [Chiloscyllium punctatum]|uniref:synergin gamma-like isoform X2 n=1 Tax=Chiloscyllium punctatum TaxID=137246 RepID=UPI003B63A6EE